MVNVFTAQVRNAPTPVRISSAATATVGVPACERLDVGASAPAPGSPSRAAWGTGVAAARAPSDARCGRYAIGGVAPGGGGGLTGAVPMSGA
jgi:hypothetical protein